MSRPNVGHLRLLQKARWRVDMLPPPSNGKMGFESVSFARTEDSYRSTALLTNLTGLPRDQRGHAKELALRLMDGVNDTDMPFSAASRVSMRDQRIRIVGQLLRLIERGRS